MSIRIIAILSLVLSGCTARLYQDNQNVVVTATSVLADHACTAINLKLLDGSGAPTSKKYDFTVNLQTDRDGRFYSTRDNCRDGVTITAVPFPSGLSAVVVYFRAAEIGNHVVRVTPMSGQNITTTIKVNLVQILGQPDLTSAVPNNGGVGASQMRAPRSISGLNERLAISDTDNNRVLLWNTLPTSSNQPADIVLGQPDLASAIANNGGVSAASLYAPRGVYVADKGLYVADTGNNRVLIWNDWPSYTGQPADRVLGQVDLNSFTVYSRSPTSLGAPQEMYVGQNQIIVMDSGDNRIMVWKTTEVTNNQPADFQLGQPDFYSYLTAVGPSQVVSGFCVTIANQRLYASDNANNRMMIWDPVPLASVNAKLAVGQPDFYTGTANTGGISSNSFSNPRGCVHDGRHFAVADYGNNRILTWSNAERFGTSGADGIIGQSNFVSNARNAGRSVDAGTISGPRGLWSDGTRLFIADTDNNRVLIIPFAN